MPFLEGIFGISLQVFLKNKLLQQHTIQRNYWLKQQKNIEQL